MGRRPGRAAAKNAAAALKKTPQYDEDEQIMDAPTSSPQEEPQDDNVDDEDEEGTPAQESEAASAPNTPAPEPVVRKRRLGRPPKNKPPDWDVPEREGSETGTPGKRGRGRGGGYGRGGGRWGKKGGPSHVTQQPIDKEGNMIDVINDELDLPEDAEGETKVDKLGNLQGGREYRCRTFTVEGRDNRLYMLSTEPARCVGFRDSYLFFTKHKRLFKIIVNDAEKHDMISRNLIPHSYKGRAIGIVTARSVFREFGAQIIVGGRRVTDDYEVTKVKEEGATEGELADPNDIIKEGQDYNKNQYVAWHGASSVYHSGAPTVPMQTGKVAEGKKRRVAINDDNWKLEHAREASRFNAALGAIRRHNLKGVYEPHTNIMHYPRSMQPTHARWEQIDDYAVEAEADESLKNGHAEDRMDVDTKTIFPPVKPIYSRNFMIVDTVFESPPASGLGVPGVGGEFQDSGLYGLSSISDDIRAELPPECLKAFEEAVEKEKQWKGRWFSEQNDSLRRDPIIDIGNMV